MKWLSAAKINLTLEILQRREDGYHGLRSIVHSIALHDELTLTLNSGGKCTLTCNVKELEFENNLCLVAAKRWMEAAGGRDINPHLGVHINLSKNIPAGAGLGGSSGNAAAVVRGLNRAHQDLLPESTLHQLAGRLGADVAFFLHGGCACMEGIGDLLTSLPPLSGYALILMPALPLATPVVYKLWDAMQVAGTLQFSAPDQIFAEPAAVRSGDLAAVSKYLRNDLYLPAVTAVPEIATLVDKLQKSAALGASMTGSGSAVFGLFESRDAAMTGLQSLNLDPGVGRWVVPLTRQAVLQSDESDKGM